MMFSFDEEHLQALFLLVSVKNCGGGRDRRRKSPTIAAKRHKEVQENPAATV